MENVAILIGLLITWIPLVLAVLLLLRLILLRHDGKKHLLSKFLTGFLFLAYLFFFIKSYNYKKAKRSEIAGNYKLTYYKCEKCPDCIVRLKDNGTYVLLRKNKEIERGDWDYDEHLFSVFLNIENGSSNDILDSTKTISYIKNDGCQEYWKKQNLLQEIDGTIVRIDTETALYGVHAFIYQDSKTKDTIRYEPKYIGHPWLNERISVGYRVSKPSNSLIFKITKPSGEVLTVSEHND